MKYIITEESEVADILPLRHMCSMLHSLLNEYSNALKEEGKQTQRNWRLQLMVLHNLVQRPSQIYQHLHHCPAAWAAGWDLPLALHLPSSWQSHESVGLFFITPVAEMTPGTNKQGGKDHPPTQPSL